ncbi:hypothetical protein LMG10661_03695 [Ralstonia syzygii subsp. syzygii]|nr:hypothetical protein LMG10661_03695 [Ralstonia syzygii subsp. syzygii]
MANQKIRVHRSQSTLIEQLKFYPEADHDDGPDALEMLWRVATQFSVDWEYTSAATARRGTAASNDWDDDDA